VVRRRRNPFTIEELYMKDERLVRGKAAADHNRITEGPPAEAADSELLTRIASGSEEAFRMLWDRFGAGVYTVCRRRLSDVGAAEDATQEAFTSVWRRAGTFDPARGSAAAWLYAVARNAAAQLVRRGQAGATLTVLDDETAGAESDPVMGLTVHAALTRLPATEREVLELAYFEDMTQTQIAERVRVPLGTVKTRTRSGLHRLAGYLEDSLE
jgi:RNA polymerase sigma-70 factor (ECF subfamily)